MGNENQMNDAWQRAINGVLEKDALERGGELGRASRHDAVVKRAPEPPKADPQAFKVQEVVAELTDAQKRMISLRFDALRADFPLTALHALFADGSEWKIGEFPVPKPAVVEEEKKKRRPRRPPEPGYVKGTLRRITTPWLELAKSAPGEIIKVRSSDFEGFDLRRAISALSALSNTRYGKGKITVQRIFDDVEGTAALIMYHDDAVYEARRKLHQVPNRVTASVRYPTQQNGNFLPTKEA